MANFRSELAVIEKAYKFLDFYQEHVPTSVEEWRKCLSRANDMIEEFDSSRFAVNVFNEILEVLDRESQKMLGVDADTVGAAGTDGKHKKQ
jgi:hypothetical protein